MFVGQVCHIEAASPGGQRFNPESTDEQRRSFENLILLCYRHHKETDNVEEFDASSLREMKKRHESLHGQKPFKVNEAFLHRLEREMQLYWEAVAAANTDRHIVPELAVRLNATANSTEVFTDIARATARLDEILDDLAAKDEGLNEEIRSHLRSLGYDLTAYDEIAYYQNPFFARNWETHMLALCNTRTDLVVAIKQAEVRFLAEYLKTHPDEADAARRLEAAKKELEEMAASVGYAD